MSPTGTPCRPRRQARPRAPARAARFRARARLVAWQHTAEARSDPELPAALTRDHDADCGAVPDPRDTTWRPVVATGRHLRRRKASGRSASRTRTGLGQGTGEPGPAGPREHLPCMVQRAYASPAVRRDVPAPPAQGQPGTRHSPRADPRAVADRRHRRWSYPVSGGHRRRHVLDHFRGRGAPPATDRPPTERCGGVRPCRSVSGGRLRCRRPPRGRSSARTGPRPRACGWPRGSRRRPGPGGRPPGST